MRLLFVLGTRPEAIKLAPVIHAAQSRAEEMESVVCMTGQHRELLGQAAEFFGIRADVDLRAMTPGQTLAGLASRCVEGIDAAICRWRPDAVVVQGDTTTALAAALAAFFRRIPVAHVEAGLRTGDLDAPWPEEFNRRVVSLASALHFTPTQRAADALAAEGVSRDRIHVTGNTVVDALLWTRGRQQEQAYHPPAELAAFEEGPLVLVTGHRRESFGPPIEAVCRAVAILAARLPDHAFAWPVHLNPEVEKPVRRVLAGRPNVHLIAPAAYPDFVWLMDRAKLILTDSGGIQEEAPSLGKPVLVTRRCTERPEAVEAGAAQLVATSPEAIVEAAMTLLGDPARHAASCPTSNPFGDGRAAERIVDILLREIPRSGNIMNDASGNHRPAPLTSVEEDEVNELPRGALPSNTDELRRLLGPAACSHLGIFPLPPGFLLSVVVPIFNERDTLAEILRQIRAVPIPKEIILVDDGSTDGTRELLAALEGEPDLRIIHHPRNRGKGAALRTGFGHVQGDVVVIQDADLEYSPSQYPQLIQPIVEGVADVVYGSRFLAGGPHRVLYFWHSVANRMLTTLSNMFTDLNLTDMETCYKVFRREVIEAIRPTLKQERFGIEPELTAKFARRRYRIFEIGIRYTGRTYEEGKKIGLKDAFEALWCTIRYWLYD
ncbi:MAG: UDP-N-acetylglucosamine 2-epimerase (non-hydrolyzing) [Pirellulales bacterium]|nr:UDP-N-acetylglucosamine 2-epimerase (non-hydrolyzing) [Pirellulales bacterium]